MPPVISIFFGALFTLGAAYGLGRGCLAKLAAPRTIVFATGASLLSLIVFLLMLAGAAGRISFAVVGVLAMGGVLLNRPGGRLAGAPQGHPAHATIWLLVPYGLLYFVQALAPEIQPDAIGYHLGSVAEYLRLGGFPDRVGFYGIMPQGAEMLFAFGFAFGGHSAAKLIHFAFLVLSFPLILEIGRRLKLDPPLPAMAATFYVVTPVVGASGTCAYNDAAMVFFVLAAVYPLLAWREEGNDWLLVPAGLAAGFCGAIKLTGLVAPAAIIVFLAWRRKWKPLLIFTLLALVMIAPWTTRAAVLTGNPVAPVLNRLFPNPYFHIWSEGVMAERLRSYGGPSWTSRVIDLTLHGATTQGLLGPVLLLSPLALLALRRPSGRLLLPLALLAAVPWYLNTGARFLMPALPFLALALLAAVPRRIAWGILFLHAFLSWPAVTALYAHPYVWRLHGFPVRAALRMEPEPEYLRRTLPEYRVAKMIDQAAPPKSRILDLVGAPTAYSNREILLFWQSARADKWSDALKYAFYQDLYPFYDLTATWPEQGLTALRFRLAATGTSSWGISEVRLYRGNFRLRPSARWSLDAWPNVWEAPLAFDANLTTRWAAWETARPGAFIEVQFDRPQWLSAATLTSFRVEENVRVSFHGRGLDGKWRALSEAPVSQIRRDGDLKRQATRALKIDGITHILAPLGIDGHGPTGQSLLDSSQEWGVELAGREDAMCLFRIL